MYAQQEGLEALLYPLFRGRDVLPAEIEDQLRTVYFRNATRNTLMQHELAAALRALQAAGVPVLVLKGAALTQEIYHNLALRPMSDVDLLTKLPHLQAALAALHNLGYQSPAVEARNGTILAYENELVLHRVDPPGPLLELHWGLFDSPYYQERLSLDWFWESSTTINLGGELARILGPEASLLHACAHLALHHSSDGHPQMLWRNDIAEMLYEYRKRLDWDELLHQAVACELVLSLQHILLSVVEQWQAPIPPAVRERLEHLQPGPEEQRIFAWLATSDRPVAQRFWADFASLPTWRTRLGYALDQLFPNPAYMRQTYSLPLPLAYPYRWATGLSSAWRYWRRTK